MNGAVRLADETTLSRTLLVVAIAANPLILHALREIETAGLVTGSLVLWLCLARLAHYGLSGAALLAALGVFVFSFSSPWASTFVLAVALCLPLISPHRVLLMQALPFYLIVFTPALILFAGIYYWSAVTGYMPWPGLAPGADTLTASLSPAVWEAMTGNLLLIGLALAGFWVVLLAPALLWQAVAAPTRTAQLAAVFAAVVSAAGTALGAHFFAVPPASLLSVCVSAQAILWPHLPDFRVLIITALISWCAGGLALILYG